MKDETLIGIVTPIKWDDHHRVTAVALSATDEQEYWIENGERFINLMQKCVKVTGHVKRGKKTIRSIEIKRYDVIESF